MNSEVAFLTTFLLLVAIQLFYHWRYFAALNSYESNIKLPIEKRVSVVVAARNELINLPELLNKILSQDHPSFELIIVNDRSTDQSLELLTTWQMKDPRLIVVNIDKLPTGWNGKKYALKKGIEVAQYDLLLLTDADCIPSSDQWISKMTNHFDDKTNFVLGVSPYQKTNGLLNQLIQYETLLTAIQYLSFAINGAPYMGVGRNLAYRKNIFLAHEFNGLEGKTGGDDDLFVNAHATRGNTKICIDLEAQMISIPKKTWKEYFIQKIRHLSVGKSYQKKDQTRLAVFALSSLLVWIMLFFGAFIGIELTTLLVIFGIRCLSIYIIFTKSGRKLNVKLAYWALPMLDLCFNIYYPILGLVALTAKKIKWS